MFYLIHVLLGTILATMYGTHNQHRMFTKKIFKSDTDRKADRENGTETDVQRFREIDRQAD